MGQEPTKGCFIDGVDLIQQYKAIRFKTVDICEPLEIEDMVIQPVSYVSPPKWHLAHTTWFFVNFILHRYGVNFPWPDDSYPQLFNSYYKSQGKHWVQGRRGDLSRPTVNQIICFRRDVDEALVSWLLSFNGDVPFDVQNLLRLGLEHEQQHQELLLMDIKFILSRNPSKPAYLKTIQRADPQANKKPLKNSESDVWCNDGGLYEFGENLKDCRFCFDNETPRHNVYLNPYNIEHKTVSNEEYANFIADGAYEEPSLWLSEGWDFINENQIRSPLYWYSNQGAWLEYTLAGERELVLNAPVAHISYHEAYAYARWANKRLPTEFEWELYANHKPREGAKFELFQESNLAYAHYPEDQNHFTNVNGGLWEWTASTYSPYPGYTSTHDAFGEYNGKFMINQMVLRGGCFATPKGHYRTSYRNFYNATQRWPFTSIRLAGDSV